MTVRLLIRLFFKVIALSFWIVSNVEKTMKMFLVADCPSAKVGVLCCVFMTVLEVLAEVVSGGTKITYLSPKSTTRTRWRMTLQK